MSAVLKLPKLEEFTKDPAPFVARVIATREPIYLAVEGGEPLVILDAETYRRARREIQRQSDIEAVREALEDMANGDTGQLIEEFFSEFEAEHKIKLRS